MNSITRRGARALALVVALALAPVLTQAGPAAADQLRYTDATGDIQKVDFADEDFTPVADPDATNGDIKDVFLHYRAGRLVIRANYVDLRPRRDTSLIASGMIKTNEKRRWIYQVQTAPPRHAGRDVLVKARNGRRACEIGHFIDYRENFTRVVVPLRCLSNPRWVKVSVGAATIRIDEEALEEWFENGGDEADLPPDAVVYRGDNAPSSGILDRMRFTPRVHR